MPSHVYTIGMKVYLLRFKISFYSYYMLRGIVIIIRTRKSVFML